MKRKQAEIRIDPNTGFLFYRGYRDTPEGRKSFYKNFGKVTLRKAKELLLEEQTKFRNLPAEKEREGTIRQAVNSYLEHHAQSLSEVSRESVKYYFEKLWLPFFGDTTVDKITVDSIGDYKVKRTRDGMKDSSIHREIAVLKSICSRALQSKIIKVNPFTAFRLPKFNEKGRTEFFSRDQWNAFLEGLKKTRVAYLIPYFETLLRTGSRLSEITGLKTGDINFETGIVNITLYKTNDIKPHPMSEELRQILKKHFDSLENKLGWFFPHSSGHRLTRDNIEYAVEVGLKAAGIQTRLSPHSIRHTAASWSAQAGFKEYQIAALTGHTNPHHLRRYMHLDPEHLKGIVENLNQKMSNG